jgi:hypothetical protein
VITSYRFGVSIRKFRPSSTRRWAFGRASTP